MMQIITNNNQYIHLEIADAFLKRFLGLMGRKELPMGHGLLLAPCSSIHMMFMRFPLDVVYIDKSYTILKVVKNLQPWTGFSLCLSRQCWGVIELSAGSADKYDLQVGTQLKTSS